MEEMMKFCHSCSAPLSMPEFQGKDENYCKFCKDDEGKMASRETVVAGIAQWLQSWTPNLSMDQATKRAEHYIKAMPHWAD